MGARRTTLVSFTITAAEANQVRWAIDDPDGTRHLEDPPVSITPDGLEPATPASINVASASPA